MHPIALSILGISALLTTISVVVPLARRLMLPYTLVLAFMGVLIGLLGYLKLDTHGFGADLLGGLRELGLLDNAFIDVYLPPLLFSAGLTVDVRHIIEDIWHVTLLALVAVIGCTLFVGYGLDVMTGVGLLPCLLIGTIVSTTDTAAVVNIFREVGAPKRLSAIVEGEALFNDAAAIALFGLFLAMLTQGKALEPLAAGRDFFVALVGGAAFGFVVARAGCWLISTLRDTVTTEVTLTIALTYFTFIVGNEVFGVSGVVAVVTLAIVIGSVGRTRVSPGSWEILHKVWEHLDFWATSLIFVTSAMFVPRALTAFGWEDLLTVAVTYCAALASRAAVIWGMMPTFAALGASKPLSNSYKGVLWWGGMRGAVTIALALATAATDGVPTNIRHLVLATSIGYVIASLTLNGLSLRPLMQMLKLDKFNDHDRVLRNRVVSLARHRIKRDLHDIAQMIGHDAEELSRSIVPPDVARKLPVAQDQQLRMALDTWCHHEHDLVLTFRERGILSRHHADLFRTHADRLMNALHAHDVAGYSQEAHRLLQPPLLLRTAFWLFRHLRLRAPITVAIADRMERLIGELLLLRELIRQADSLARQLFGRETAAELHQLLEVRLREIECEIEAIENSYPDFARAMHTRHLALVAVGLVEAEYRRHLTEATISADVFEDLEAQRRDIAASFAKRPHLDFRFNVRRAIARFPILEALAPRKDFYGFRSAQAFSSRIRPYLTFPGERIGIPRSRRNSVFLIISGWLEARTDAGTRVLGPGDIFGAAELIEGCVQVAEARSSGYVNILEVTKWPSTAMPDRNAANVEPAQDESRIVAFERR